MMWLNLQSGTRRETGGLHGNPWARASFASEAPLQSEGFSWDGARDEEVLVLRTLIEDFGGEATGASLSRRIDSNFRPLGRMKAASRLQIGAVLAELVTCGALTLEDLDEHDVIARITPDGARLAYASRAYGGSAFKAR